MCLEITEKETLVTFHTIMTFVFFSLDVTQRAMSVSTVTEQRNTQLKTNVA